ncbi:MAG: Abi family protein [Candidatus Sabulitectum sp.]|nr:Abi family protein [Candidatus Sabulitectum sp.]
MPYNKPPKSYPDLAQLAIDRGLEGVTREHLTIVLERVSYCRFRTYWHKYLADSINFKEDTNFGDIWIRYIFDGELRNLVFCAIQEVEVSLRNSIMHHHVHSHGIHGYLNASALPDLKPTDRTKLLSRIKGEIDRTKEHFAKRHISQFPGEDPPLWIVVDLMTMGMLLTFYNGMKKNLRAAIASKYHVSEEVFNSWMKTLNHLRNICAHHSRLWNRTFGLSPKIPRERKNPEWHIPSKIYNERTFGVLSMIYHLLKCTNSEFAVEWRGRLKNLFLGYGCEIPEEVGFPENWFEYQLWWVD